MLTDFTGADAAAADGGMMSHPLDIGYMGVHTVWTNNLGGLTSSLSNTTL